MKELPKPEVYEEEFKYMPWGKILQEILDYVNKEAPQGGSLVDLMCGPGYLLNEIQKIRPDLKLVGVDIDTRYIEYAKKQYPGIDFIEADVSNWQTDKKFDVVLCTGGLHHLPYDSHQTLIEKFAQFIKEDGFVIVADPYVGPYTDETSRRLAATELGAEYLKAVIRNGASDGVTSATIDIMYNDVLPNGEYKTYIERIRPMVESKFNSVELHKTWPGEKSDYGDYYWILKQPK